jgi:hypothetical protein
MLYQIDPIAWMMAGEHRHLLLNEPARPRLPYHLRPARETGPSFVVRSAWRVRVGLERLLAHDRAAETACCPA